MIELTDELMDTIGQVALDVAREAGEEIEEGDTWDSYTEPEKKEARDAVQIILTAVERSTDTVMIDRTRHEELLKIEALARQLVPQLWNILQPTIIQLAAAAQAAGFLTPTHDQESGQ